MHRVLFSVDDECFFRPLEAKLISNVAETPLTVFTEGHGAGLRSAADAVVAEYVVAEILRLAVIRVVVQFVVSCHLSHLFRDRICGRGLGFRFRLGFRLRFGCRRGLLFGRGHRVLLSRRRRRCRVGLRLVSVPGRTAAGAAGYKTQQQKRYNDDAK